MKIVGPLAAAALCATAAGTVLPRAVDSAALLAAQDDPARLADLAAARTLSASTVQAEIEAALAADDIDLAMSFQGLARSRGIAVDPGLEARIDRSNATGVQAMRAAANFTHGFVTGAPDDLAGLAGTAAGDLFVFGDVRDAVREGVHLARGEPADELVLGLACAGIAVTAGTYASFGGGAPARIGLSLVKAARKTGRIAAPVAAFMARSMREAVDTEAFGAAVTKASFSAPVVALRAARDAVKVEGTGAVVALLRDVGRVQSKAGTRAALDGLRLAEEPADVGRLARLAESQGGKTRAILKLAGRAAFALTAAAIDLAGWLFSAVCAMFGFCCAVKRTAERSTERYLAWRKARPPAGDFGRGYAPGPGCTHMNEPIFLVQSAVSVE